MGSFKNHSPLEEGVNTTARDVIEYEPSMHEALSLISNIT